MKQKEKMYKIERKGIERKKRNKIERKKKAD